jgi:hypothetical protein
VHSCGGAEERKRCDGDAAAKFSHAMAPVRALSAAATGLYGEWRGYSYPAAARSSVGFVKIK